MGSCKYPRHLWVNEKNCSEHSKLFKGANKMIEKKALSMSFLRNFEVIGIFLKDYIFFYMLIKNKWKIQRLQ